MGGIECIGQPKDGAVAGMFHPGGVANREGCARSGAARGLVQHKEARHFPPVPYGLPASHVTDRDVPAVPYSNLECGRRVA